ncbi:MAG: helix-turn-helix transcriptional regulator [Geobacter sp.]|nr:MAG: helix-turn-helix transcriptional regulator [Geobacter sp.]
MCARLAGKSKTPPRVVELLKKEVNLTSQAATARATGLTLRGVQNYLKAIGEPTQASLEKIANYFRVTVRWLRGESDEGGPIDPERLAMLADLLIQRMKDMLGIYRLLPPEYKKTYWLLVSRQMETIDGVANWFGASNISKSTKAEYLALAEEIKRTMHP